MNILLQFGILELVVTEDIIVTFLGEINKFMETENTTANTSYDSEKFKRREIMRNEYRRMQIEMNQIISQKSDEIAARWIEELKDSK